MMIGFGSDSTTISEGQIRDICTEAFAKKTLDRKNILVIIPDDTRTAPIDIMFRVLYELLAPKVDVLDFLVALGTHPPLSDEAINRLVGITTTERNATYTKARFFNHDWQDENRLQIIGTITAEEVEEISEGLMQQRVDVTINKLVYDYDLLLIVGPVFPHEVVGFSGGNKYLFPGIAGKEIINLIHWLGALVTNLGVIGKKYTLGRRMIDKAAALLSIQRMCVSLVVKGEDLIGLYTGTPEDAWEAASDLSHKTHIIYKDRPFKQVLSQAPEMYADLWTAGKCMYKLEPVVADGGELIIYAPHINEVSVTHGGIIKEIGYHVLDYFTKQMDRFSHIPGGIMAHSTHIKGIGVYEDGVEKPRVNVVLATGISKGICDKINLGYRDPTTIHVNEWTEREDEGILCVPKAGEILYKLKN